MDFSTVKGITIPKGNVSVLRIGGQKVWQRLPSEYQEVEWIGSNYNDYIILDGLGANIPFKIETQQRYVNYNESDICIECNAGPCAWYGINPQGYYTLGGGQVSNIKGSKTDFDVIVFNKTVFNTYLSATLNVNNNQILSRQSDEYFYGTKIALFGCIGSDGNIVGYRCSLQKKYFRVYINNVLTYNLIPCYRVSDTEIGMYDLVNGVFYTNQGTGTFTKGNDL